ncbi:MAG: hypothetical protein I8H71_00345 [Xanthomonadaceae bacterium]|nr:hypothetical protein [Xanthomonadaceae bacterium]MBH2008122.1 hypothetical protein [Xanthomonadaceae bacterium]
MNVVQIHSKGPEQDGDDGPMCINYRFYEISYPNAVELDGNDATGFCRRYPPVVITFGDQLEFGHIQSHPYSWCGEHQP